MFGSLLVMHHYTWGSCLVFFFIFEHPVSHTYGLVAGIDEFMQMFYWEREMQLHTYTIPQNSTGLS